MSGLKKDGIRAVMSENAERETLKQMGQRGGTVGNEDRELIEAIAEPWICVEEPPCEDTESVHWEELLTALTAALATVRKEEREATFKVQCTDCAEGSTPTFDQDARWYYHGLGHAEVGCSASKLRIAALEASTSEKDDMNG